MISDTVPNDNNWAPLLRKLVCIYFEENFQLALEIIFFSDLVVACLDANLQGKFSDSSQLLSNLWVFSCDYATKTAPVTNTDLLNFEGALKVRN